MASFCGKLENETHTVKKHMCLYKGNVLQASTFPSSHLSYFRETGDQIFQ